MHATASRILASALSIACTASFAHAATVRHAGGEIVLEPDIDAPAYQIRLVGPNDFVAELTRLDTEVIAFAARDKAGWPDGDYRYEIWPIVGVVKRTDATPDMATATPARAVSGTFAIDGGRLFSSIAGMQPSLFDDATKDQVIADDLVVQGSGCFGIDCSNGESFGTDTIRLKSNNTRIKFDDTSVAGNPDNDWQLTANDAAMGGANKFSIEDITGGLVPFTITAGAPNNSLFIASTTGNVGVGTSTPARSLHVSRQDTPTLRLEQTGIGIFLPQTWDIIANDANFAIRDITAANQLPFRIRPGAPISSLDIASTGNVGLGTASPQTKIHMFGNTPTIRFEHNDGSTPPYTFELGAATGFAVRDVTGGNTLPFHIGVGAPSSSLNVFNNGNVGVGLPLPTVKLHVAGNGAMLNLEGTDHTFMQFYPDGPATRKAYFGFPAAANNNLTLANEISGSHIVLLPTGATGNIIAGSTVQTGIGSGADKFAVAGSIGSSSNQFNVNPSVNFQMVHRGTGGWDFLTDSASKRPLRIERLAPTNQMVITATGTGLGTAAPTERLHVIGNIVGTGNITIAGTLSQGSDRNSKENFASLDPADVLDKLTTLDVTRWNYKADGGGVQHIGPMAQDFYALFGLGEAETKIAPLDTSGVTIVAVQELARRLQQRDAEVAVLREQLDRLNAQVAALVDAQRATASMVNAETPAAAPATTGM